MKKKLLVAVGAVLGLCIVSVAGVAFLLLHRVEGAYFESGGVRIHFTDEGGPGREPVILIHGYAANADINWRLPRITAMLRNAGYRVIAMDDRGHGLSGKPHDPAQYGMEMVYDVVRLMDHLHIERAHVAGYSMGGFITLKLLATHPERLLSAAVCGAGWYTLDSPRVQTLVDLTASFERDQGFGPLLAALEPGGDPSAIKLWAMNTGIGMVNDIAALAAVAPTMLEWAVTEEQLRANTVPALVICGERDPLVEAVRNLDGVLANAEVVYVAGGNHATTVGKRQFRDALRRHIELNGETRGSAVLAAKGP